MEMKTPNMADENFKKLIEIFPNIVTETIDENGNVIRAINKEMLEQEISTKVVDGPKERYQFTWPEKKQSILAANAPTTNTLRPSVEDSVNFDTTKNLYIEGDNLEVLKILQETYLGKVKMIYIDPPYNTGSDFVYEDDFAEDMDEYMGRSGQFDEEGNRLFVNTDRNGRFHTDWLNMIYPRLKMARNLLSYDGVIFISIDDSEQSNMKKICDEIFGERNFIEEYIWESTFRPDNSSNIVRKNAEFVLCYSKDIKSVSALIGSVSKSEGMPSLTKNSMNKSILNFPANTVKTFLKDGVYKSGKRESGYNLLNDVIVRDGLIINEFDLEGRVIWGQDYLLEQISKGTEIIIKSEGFVPYSNKIEDSFSAPNKIIPRQMVGDVLEAGKEINGLFGTSVFSYPKPVSLIRYFLKIINSKDCTVIDFFSGSATTAQATIQLNAEDGGNRQFIMVQLPENLEENLKTSSNKGKQIITNAIDFLDKINKPHLLTEIGKERIRRAGAKIKEDFKDQEGIEDLDIGFRVLKVDSSNMEDVYYNPMDLQRNMLLEMSDNIKSDRTDLDLLFQVMLDLGIEVSSEISEFTIEGKKCFSVEGDFLIACFDKGIDTDLVKEIANRKPIYAVILDRNMESDSLLTNFEQIFKEISPDTVRKVL